jgi:hypothetical protein
MTITAPGVYSIDIEAYHNDPHLCAGPSISASGLKAVANCPALYWATSPYNPKRWPSVETKALNLGRAAHALVLGEPEFLKYFIVSPYDDFRTKEAREWRDSQRQTILKSDDLAIVRDMADAQRASACVMHAFEHGRPEMSLIWKDKETGIWLRSRPDWLPDDPGPQYVIDYKTAVSIEPRKLSADAWKFGYHIQAALQRDAVQEVMGARCGVAHVVQEKTPPYLCDLRMFQEEQLDYGARVYRKALRRFADCMASGKWPAYSDGGLFFETPYYIQKQMEEFNDDGAQANNGDYGGNASADEGGNGNGGEQFDGGDGED